MLYRLIKLTGNYNVSLGFELKPSSGVIMLYCRLCSDKGFQSPSSRLVEWGSTGLGIKSGLAMTRIRYRTMVHVFPKYAQIKI
jgi:hypothetical protein